MKKITGEDYEISYDEGTATITIDGSLRLLGASSYMPIIQLLDDVAAGQHHRITVNLQNLKFLNSSGINALSKFIIKVRNQKSSQIIVRGSEQFPWQNKSLRNLQRLMPDLQLEIES